MKVFELNTNRQIIGRAGERGGITLTVNIRRWLEAWPDGLGALMCQRPDGRLFPVAVTVSGEIMSAELPEECLQMPGVYSYTPTWTENETVRVGRKYECVLMAAYEPPKPCRHGPDKPHWATEVLTSAEGIKRDAETIIANISTAAANAEISTRAKEAAIAAKAGAEEAQAAAGQSASAAAAAEENAAQSADSANTAKTAAETARSGAETAKSDAESAAADAAHERESAMLAAEAAGSAMLNAETAQAAAETAQASAQQNAQAASQSATGANAAKTDAEASKTAAAASAAAAQAVKDSIPADYTSLNNDVIELKSAMTSIGSSSMGSGTALASGKRWLLNVDNPIPDGTHIGTLFMVANSLDTTTDVKIELATFSDGIYTVYESKTVSIAVSTTAGDIVRVADINKDAVGNTYIFITASVTTKFRAASVTGKKLVLSDDITNTTFATRSVANYEVDYILYLGATARQFDAISKNTIKTAQIPTVPVEITDAVLFANKGYYFDSNTAEMVSAGSDNWVASDYIPVGYGITVTGSAYSAYRPQIVEYDSGYNIIGQQKKGEIGSVTKTYTPGDGVSFVRLQSTINTGNIASGTQLTIESVPKVYHVKKDGTGDYTNLADAIAEATRRFDAVVYVGDGTWNILDELGADYIAAVSDAKRGIILKNRVHVICSSKAYIKCLYSGSDANVINYLSAFNAGPYGFTLENADIEVANVRYCVHDERDADTDAYNNYYINCRMKNTNQTSGSRAQCIGGGLGYDGHIIIDGCTFENPLRENYGIVSYHNAHGTAIDSRSLIEVKGSYFYGSNTFRAGYYGNATKMTQCLVHGNSMGAEPYVTQEDQSFTNVNMEIIAWNNEIRTN